MNLEIRTKKFSLDVRDFCLQLKRDIINREYIVQLVRSAGSIGANYLEANDGLSPKDKRNRIKISKKEAKETVYWLNHILTYDEKILEEERKRLLNEANELTLILAAILRKLTDE